MSKGGNRGRPDPRRGEGAAKKNADDYAVSRDPDIAGVNRQEAKDVHARGHSNNEGRG